MDSILGQTLGDWELVVCDSHSEDGTWEYLRQFEDDPRVHLHAVPKEGLYAGWNECLRRATGEYIYIATADDTMEADCLERLCDALENQPDLDIVLSEVRRIDEQGRALGARRPDVWKLLDPAPGRIERVPGTSFFLLLCGLASGFGSITGLMVRRRLFEKTGLFPADQWFLGDCEWALRAVLHSDVLVLPDVLATWRSHGDQASSAWNLRAAHIFLRTLERVLESEMDRMPDRWRAVPRWRDRLFRARRVEAELATKLVASNLRDHWHRFPGWIADAARIAPEMLLKRLAGGLMLRDEHRADAVAETRRLLADFGERWPAERRYIPQQA